MKTITKYQCEICNREYLTKEGALHCESEGKEYPLGTVGEKYLVKDEWNGGFGTAWNELLLGEIEDNEHYITYNFGDMYEMTNEGEEIFHPTEIIYGNDEFKDKCKLVK